MTPLWVKNHSCNFCAISPWVLITIACIWAAQSSTKVEHDLCNWWERGDTSNDVTTSSLTGFVSHYYQCVLVVDGTKRCSMCTEKAAKDKFEEVNKPSQIHKKIKDNKSSLFLHPIPPTTRGAQDRFLTIMILYSHYNNTITLNNHPLCRHLGSGSPKRVYKKATNMQGTNPTAAVLLKRNLAAKYYGPIVW